ncbi:MAG: DUF354 domain-containing protein [Methanosarcinales archaeon]
MPKLRNKAYKMIANDYKLLEIAKRFKPDILVSCSSPYAAHVSKLVRKPHIAFENTEHAKLVMWLTFPFTDVILTPSCFKKDLGKKQIRYKGYKELAYLHPHYFKPDSSVLDDLGFSKEDNIIILRFAKLNASHDLGIKGFEFRSNSEIIKFLEKIERYGRVVLTSEYDLGRGFEKYKIKLPPERMHDLLAYATLYVGEGATMASEAGILGVPSIFLYGYKFGSHADLQKYGLVHPFSDHKSAIDMVFNLLQQPSLKKECKRKRERMLKHKIDVTKFMTDFIENYLTWRST